MDLTKAKRRVHYRYGTARRTAEILPGQVIDVETGEPIPEETRGIRSITFRFPDGSLHTLDVNVGEVVDLTHAGVERIHQDRILAHQDREFLRAQTGAKPIPVPDAWWAERFAQTRMKWRAEAFRDLWVYLLQFRNIARTQARKMRDAIRVLEETEATLAQYGWGPTLAPGQRISKLPGRQNLQARAIYHARRIGHHAGRLLALRMAAYDAEPTAWKRKSFQGLVRERARAGRKGK